MDFEVYLADSNKYIVCRGRVPVTIEITRAMSEKIAEISAATDVRNRLIDLRDAPNSMSVTTNYDLAYKEMDEMQIERSTKVAVLYSPGDTSHDFVCTAIRNSGFNLRTFTDEAAAIVWLEE
jgi:hypothetical protein